MLLLAMACSRSQLPPPSTPTGGGGGADVASGAGGMGVGGRPVDGNGGATGAGGDIGDGGTKGGTGGGAAPAVDRTGALEIMRRVADYELTRFGVATNANWVRAVFYTGLLAFYRTTGDAKYLTATQAWGQSNGWRLGTDSGGSVRWADNQAAVQTYADLYLMNPVAANDVMVAAGRAAFDQMVARRHLHQYVVLVARQRLGRRRHRAPARRATSRRRAPARLRRSAAPDGR